MAAILPDTPDKDTLHVIYTHIDMFHNVPIEHTSWNVVLTAFRLQIAQTPENDSLVVGEAVSSIGNIVIRAGWTHHAVFLCKESAAGWVGF